MPGARRQSLVRTKVYRDNYPGPNLNAITGFLSEKGSMSQIISRSLSPARRLLHGRRKYHRHLSPYVAVVRARIKATGTSRNLHLAFSIIVLPSKAPTWTDAEEGTEGGEGDPD